jgi:type II secretory pathway predicted ATPase ExeA
VASLLIFARLWRLAKLVSTVTVGTTEVNDIEGRPGRTVHASPHAREETLLEAVQEGWRREKAALVAELQAAREKVQELEGRLMGVGDEAGR